MSIIWLAHLPCFVSPFTSSCIPLCPLSPPCIPHGPIWLVGTPHTPKLCNNLICIKSWFYPHRSLEKLYMPTLTSQQWQPNELSLTGHNLGSKIEERIFNLKCLNISDCVKGKKVSCKSQVNVKESPFNSLTVKAVLEFVRYTFFADVLAKDK